MPVRKLLILLLIIIIGISCSKNGSGAGDRIGIYRLKTQSAVALWCRVDSANLVLANDPLITNNEIRSYSAGDHEFTIAGEAGAKLKDVRDYETLAMVVGDEVVYYFLNKPLYSSSSCANNISVSHWGQTQLSMNFITMPGVPTIPDLRNNTRLINALRSQGKLK